MTKNEDVEGSNPYAGGHPNVASDLVVRKRNIAKEKSISPRAFNATHRTSSRHDDKITTKTLNQLASS